MDCVRLINYVRRESREGRSIPSAWKTASVFDDDAYLQPTLEDDAVLYSLEEVDESAFSSTGPTEQNDDREREIQELRKELVQLRSNFAAYKDEVRASFQTHLESIRDDTPAPDSTPARRKQEQNDTDGGYFSSYAQSSIHAVMLKDTVRTDAYRDFIYDNKHLFRNKIVLDVGCGTGILSMFCAKAGAKQVLAVDNSDIIDKARVIVFENGVSNVVKCLKGKIEEVPLPVDKVDVIVSEWMGYGLLYESMLDSVLWARDRYLDREAGLMVPSRATLQIAPLIDSEVRIEQIDFWKDVYGFDMSCMLDGSGDSSKDASDTNTKGNHDNAREALTLSVNKADTPSAGDPKALFHDLNLYTIQVRDLEKPHPFRIPWPILTTTTDRMQTKPMDGWLIWFDVFFTSRGQQSSGSHSFSTGPHSPQTHWHQLVLLLKEQNLSWQHGDILSGTVQYKKTGGGFGTLDNASIKDCDVYEGDEGGQRRSIDIEIVWRKEVSKVESSHPGEEAAEDPKENESRKTWSLD